jgi:hypothetical protein
MRANDRQWAGYSTVNRPRSRGWTAVWQARLGLLIMINVAQLWILSAAVEAALAHDFGQLPPLVISSGVCWLIALSIFLWWKPAPARNYTGRPNETRDHRLR